MTNETYLFMKIDDVWLWSKRLYHVNLDNLVNISKMKKVIGIPRLKKPKKCDMQTMSVRKNDYV